MIDSFHRLAHVEQYPTPLSRGLVAESGATPSGIELVLTSRSLSKAEAEEAMRRFIETRLEQTDSGTVYLYLKQAEYAIKLGIENLKERAFDSLGNHLGGVPSGSLLGHNVSISYPHEWHYSSAVDDLKERHKKELAELQKREQIEGIAKQVSGKGRITVTLRE